MEPWELHPSLVHFPIAFLVAATILDGVDWYRADLKFARAVTGLYLAGVATGVLAALAGVLAYFTGPITFTESAGNKIWWHIGAAASSLTLFVLVAIKRWLSSTRPPGWIRLIAFAGAASLGYAGYLGGYMVYHGAMGIEPSLVSNDLKAKAQKRD